MSFLTNNLKSLLKNVQSANMKKVDTNKIKIAMHEQNENINKECKL